MYYICAYLGQCPAFFPFKKHIKTVQINKSGNFEKIKETEQKNVIFQELIIF